MLSLFYRQDLRDKEMEGKQAETCRLLLVHWTATGCVFHYYPSLVMDGVFNFCGTRLFYYFFLSPTG
jgi:hypothetical protein